MGNYFFTDLEGNEAKVEYTFGYKLIEAKNIQEITFILSKNNRIIKHMLQNQNLAHQLKLKQFCKLTLSEETRSKKMWTENDYQDTTLSSFLSLKMSELENKLKRNFGEGITINAEIFNPEGKVFNKVKSDLYNREVFNLN